MAGQDARAEDNGGGVAQGAVIHAPIMVSRACTVQQQTGWGAVVLAAAANALAIAMPGKGIDNCLNRVDALHAAARQDPDEYNEKKTAAFRERHALHGSRPVFAEAPRRVGGKRLARGGPIGAGHS
jgi:hypothetical protein